MNDESHFHNVPADDERPAAAEESGDSGRWKILIVDDEEGVHSEIESALKNIVFDGKGLRILKAFSAGEGRRVLLEHPDAAVIFVNGVLENASAGLELVKFIREERKNDHAYIVLGIGLPGQTPVRKIVGAYEIDEYRNQADFTFDMLYAMAISGLRSYKTSRASAAARRNLVRAARKLSGRLTASEKRSRVLLETMNEGVGVQDEHGVLTYVNARLGDMLGRRPRDMVGKPATDFLDGVDKRMFLDRKAGRQKGGAGPFEVEWIGKKGARIPTLVSHGSILDSKGGPKGGIAVVTDVSDRKKVEEALRKSESRYRNVYHTAPLAFVIWDREYRITAWNRHAEMIFGWSREEVLGRDFFDFLVPVSARAHVKAFADELLKGAIVNQSVNENVTKSGEIILCEWNNSILYDGEGAVSGAISLAMDITERGRTEKALRDSEKAYRTLAENLPGMVYRLYVRENDRIRFMNDMAFPITGRTVGELENAEDGFFRRLIVPEDLDRVEVEIEKAVAENRPFDVEYRLKRKTGDVAHVRELGRPATGSDGKPLYIDGVILDIGKRKLAEKALEESEAQKKAILDSLSMSIRFVDPDYQMIWANRTASSSVEKSPGELIGRACHEFWGIGDGPCDGCPTTKALRTRKTERAVMHFPEDEVWDMKAEPVFNDAGDVAGVIQIAREVSEKYSLDAHLRHAQKMESIGTITSGVAHNFKNILAGISMDSQLIQMLYEDNEQLLEIVKRTDESAKRGARLITELMKFSRKETRKFQTVDLSRVIREICGLVRKSFDRMIDIRIDVPSSLPVVGDHGGLSQVIMNLCTNARDAMPKGGALVIEATRDGDRARLTVSDEGCGMDADTREKCFDPFFTTKGIDMGTGLGLSTTYGIVKDHGGSIHVYSEPGKGATFKLSFPMASSDAPVEEEKPPRVTLGNGEKILIIDDEMNMLRSIKRLLDLSGYKVDDASNGVDGVARYKEWSPDVVLLDRNMPGMNGVDCAEKILEHDPEANILMISGYSNEGPHRLDDHAKSMIKGYLAKPIGIGELSRALAGLLKR